MADNATSPALDLMKQSGIDTTGLTTVNPNNPPKTDPPKTDPPKTDPPKTDPPKTDPAPGDPPKTDPPKTDPPKTDPPKLELNDDIVKEWLKKNKNLNIDSLDDLGKPAKELTDTEKAAAAEKFREQALKHAINSKFVNTKDIEDFGKETQKKPEEIVSELLKAQWKKDDPTLTDEDLDKRFRDYFKLDEPEDNWERQARNHELLARANKYFEEKYPKIVGAESNYSEHLETLAQAEAYNRRVETAIGKISKEESIEIEVTGEDGKKTSHTYKFKYSDDAIDEIKKNLLSEDSFASMKGSKEEGITLAVQTALFSKEKNKIIQTVAREHAAEMVLAEKAGRKNIPPTGPGGGSTQTNQQPKNDGPAANMLTEHGR